MNALPTPEKIYERSWLVERVRGWLDAQQRRVIGVVGAPGAGKSVMSDALFQEFGPQRIRVVPMDGFHYAQSALEALGRAARKGAQDTFDAEGFIALLRRIRAQRDEFESCGAAPDIYAPEFKREIEEPIANALRIPAQVPILVVEGNYLLLDQEPWCRVRSLLDEIHYIWVEDTVRVEQLIARHVEHGRSLQEATEWVHRSDEANARIVAASAKNADFFVRR